MRTPALARVEALALGTLIAGVLLTLFGVTGTSARSPGPLASFSAILGVFLLASSLILYAIFLVFTLMRDHEVWKRSLDNESESDRL